MTITDPLPAAHRPATARPGHRTRRRVRLRLIGITAVIVAVACGLLVVAVRRAADDSRRDYLGSDGWPRHGQAAWTLDDGGLHASPHEQPVPIASLAKLMSAYVVLLGAPWRALVVTPADVDDTTRRRIDEQSVVDVRAGERLTERQALAALLLPSANNVAIMVARRTAGSVAAFVTDMNRQAARLGMAHTRYTDPSGLSASTVSTAADQLLLAVAAMQQPELAALVAMNDYPLPVAGTVHNTDVLLGTHGFVGIKTGSDDAAEGCFTFRAHRLIGGRTRTITGVILGQPGRHLVLTGQYAARQLVDRIAG